MERRQSVLSTSSESINTDDEGQAPTSCDLGVESESSEERHPVVTAEGEGPYEKAIKYLEKHKIISLFQVTLGHIDRALVCPCMPRVSACMHAHTRTKFG